MVDVKMNFNSMEKMANSFKQAAAQLNDTMTEMKKLSKMMEDGALIGDGGSAFVDVLNRPLMKAMKDLHKKMVQMEKDIKLAVEAKKEGVTTAKGRFSN